VAPAQERLDAQDGVVDAGEDDRDHQQAYATQKAA
jgi:hypothetical protein